MVLLKERNVANPLAKDASCLLFVWIASSYLSTAGREALSLMFENGIRKVMVDAFRFFCVVLRVGGIPVVRTQEGEQKDSHQLLYQSDCGRDGLSFIGISYKATSNVFRPP
jgi:hypothetical protein